MPELGAIDPVDRLPGLGASARTALAEHGIRSIADLVWLPPSGWDDLSDPMPLARAVEEAKNAPLGKGPRRAISAVVKSASIMPIRGRRTVRVLFEDAETPTCRVHAFWFFMAHGILALAKEGARILFIGAVTVPFEPKKPPRTAHPDVLLDTPQIRTGRARYPKLGPSGAAVKKAIAHAIAEGLTPDPIPSEIARREKLPAADAILRSVHAADGKVPTEGERRAFIERLAWTEAFTRVWERLTSQAASPRGHGLPRSPKTEKALERELGFTLTKDQRSAIDEIARELEGPRPMRRLLLGDVGTGKTAVALAAAAQCIAAKKQAAILAPTSVLAEQYLAAVRPLVASTKTKVALIVAGQRAAERKESLELLASGDARLAIGTHALLREEVAIPELALVVVDEQQRLGVAQRLALVKKGVSPHLLTLSATPIPRTLALALRGELATTVLRERPKGRPLPKTELAGASDIASVVKRARAAVENDERVFWVVPRIENDEDEDADELASLHERAKLLEKALAMKVGVLHGKMPAVEKRSAMEAFRLGEAKLLVSTTVVEVGVDVPEATLMIVEDAQRYGLAQLHQLRGRVGRGERPGTCILLHPDGILGLAKARLDALVKLEDGEAIARADLELRGAGDLSGTRQHGEEDELVFLEPGANYPWLERLEDDARLLKKEDPTLERHPITASLVRRLGHALSVREEAG